MVEHSNIKCFSIFPVMLVVTSAISLGVMLSVTALMLAAYFGLPEWLQLPLTSHL
jgi:hypothetical protein